MQLFQFNFERVETQTMKKLALFTIWVFSSVLISSIFALNQEESTSIWNKENVQSELKNWLKDVQTSQQSTEK